MIQFDIKTRPKDTVESTLFGSIRGGFTGALDDKGNLKMQTERKILCLDEIGNISYDVKKFC